MTLYGAAQFFADKVSQLTGGAFKITPKPADEPIGALDVLPAVRDLEVDMGHSASYYHVNLSPVQQFGTTVPFGLTQRQQNAWLYHADGLKMLNEFYAQEHGIITFPAGSTGCQMGGWFSKEVKTESDLQGLRMAYTRSRWTSAEEPRRRTDRSWRQRDPRRYCTRRDRQR